MINGTMITAHSGSDATPNNSIEFIKKALELGVDAVEVDVRIDNSARLILRHDDAPEDVLKECISLVDAFLLVSEHPSIKINCDLKQYDLELPILRLAEEMGISDRIILSGSVAINKCYEPLRNFPKAEIFLNIEEIFKMEDMSIDFTLFSDKKFFDESMQRVLVNCARYHIKVVNANYMLCTDRFIELMDRNGIQISAWTVNAEQEILRFLDKKIRNITTRNAVLTLSIRDRFITV